MLTRRGFLKSLGAAIGTAAVFDPKTALWLPAPSGDIVLVAAPMVEQQLELNELATVFAQMFSHQLRKDREMTSLDEIFYEHSGAVHLTKPELLLDGGLGRGKFVSHGRQMLPGVYPSWEIRSAQDGAVRRWVEGQAKELAWRVRRGSNMFAPISSELRQGVPFSDDVLIGTGRDPETGLSARVLRWTTDKGEHYTGVEVAGGQWKPWVDPSLAVARAREYYRRDYDFGDPVADHDHEEWWVRENASDFEEDV